MLDKRLIDANALKVRMFRSKEFNRDTGSFDLPVVPWHDIEDADTIDAVEVVHARWVHEQRYGDSGGWVWRCSACRREAISPIISALKYCHSCGAKMDAKEG